MSRLQFLLMGIGQDPHLIAVSDALIQRGVSTTTVNSRALHNTYRVFQSIHEETVKWDGIWIRYLPPLYPNKDIPLSISAIQKQRATRSFILQWLRERKRTGTLVLPPLNEGTYDQFKISDLKIAQESGLDTPRTVCVINPIDADNFIAQEQNNVIVKPIIGGQYAQKLSAIHLKKWFEDYGPLTLQETIKGLSCRILFFAGHGLKAFVSSELNEIDWRTQDLHPDSPVRWAPLKLPKEIIQKLARFLESAQLKIASIDMILAGDQFYFLEANTTPSWLDLPSPHAEEITQKMADILCQGTVT